MDERRIAQTAGIALKIAKKFAGRSTWSQKTKGPGIYAPLKRWSQKGHSKLTTAFMHKVQHAKEHREEAERRQQSRGHASRTPTEEHQRASKAPQKAPKAPQDQEAQKPHKAAKIHAVGSIGSIGSIRSAKTNHEKSHSSTQAAQHKQPHQFDAKAPKATQIEKKSR